MDLISWLDLFLRQQIRQRRSADLRPVLEQRLKAIVACGHGNYRQRVGVRSRDVARRIADHADPRPGAGHLSGLAHGIRDQLRADGEMVAEAAKTEPLPQSSLFD